MATVAEHAERYKKVVYIALIAILEIFFFRSLFAPGAMLGDSGDSRLNNLIMEHWYHVFQGKEAVDTLSEFYPVTDTLSYTDMLLGDSLLYSLLRALGTSMFTANTITLVTIHCIGSFSLFYLLEAILNVNEFASFMGVLTFSFANGYAIRVRHTQMMALSLVPVILIFAVQVLKHFDENKKRRLYLWLFFSSYALLAYTGWYTFFFSAIFVIIFIIAGLIVCLIHDRTAIKQIFTRIKSRIIELILCLVYFALLLIPFLKMYLPTSEMSGKRSWDTVLFYSPQLIDIINVGSGNLVLGKLFSYIKLSRENKGEGELQEGFSIIMLITLATLIVLYFVSNHKKAYKEKKSSSNLLIITFICAAIFSLFLTIDFDGWSMWWVVWNFIPGAGALRAISRWYFFLLLPLGILIAVLLDRQMKGSKNLPVSVLIMLAAVTCLFNVNTRPLAGWTSSDMYQYLDSVPTPPEGAKVIALQKSDSDPNPAYEQLDAWMIADHYGLKTINGYSGQVPPDWNLGDITSEDYISNILAWRGLNNMTEDVYVYDESTEKWSIASPPVLDMSKEYSFNEGGWAYFAGDWFGPEDWGRWSSKEASIDFKLSDIPESDQVVTFTAHSFAQGHTVNVSINGKSLSAVNVTTDDQLFSVVIPANHLESNNELTFALQDPGIRPCDVDSNNGDDRELGIGFVSMSVADFEAPEVKLDTSYDFSTDGWAYFDSGWYGTEDWGRWMNKKANIDFALKDIPKSDINVVFQCHSFFQEHILTVNFNGKDVTEVKITPDSKTYSVTIPLEYLYSSNRLSLTLNEEAIRPCDVDQNNSDDRQLGVGFESMWIDDVDAEQQMDDAA